MPSLIKYIDKFAREKQCDVLMLRFETSAGEASYFGDYNKRFPRTQIISWLESNGIGWEACALQGDMGYSGNIYIDLPFDTSDPVYLRLVGHLENPDGTMKIKGVQFGYLPLDAAMKYAEQDAPDYWERQPN